MKMFGKLVLAVLLSMLVAGTLSGQTSSPAEPFEATIPETKVGLSPSYGSIIPLKDGKLLWVWGTGRARKPLQPFSKNISTDGGRTWSDPTPLKMTDGEQIVGVFNANLVRLRSGKLGLFVTPEVRPDRIAFHVSTDEGETWSKGVIIADPPIYSTGDKAVVLSSGRIIMPVYGGLPGPKLEIAKPKLLQHGELLGVGAGQGFWYSYTMFSDDEGATWKRSKNEVFVLLDKGTRGLWAAGEPSVIELKDGKLMMTLRTGLSRVFRSLSPDGGETWLEPEAMSLVSPPAPLAIKRIPSTGDLLVVWQQVSNWEGMIGLYRHRLSCAISKDEGVTWQNHRNLESMDDTTVVENAVEVQMYGVYRQPLDRKRYHRAPGLIRCSYPTLTFLGDTAVISYGLSSLGDENTLKQIYGTDTKAVFEKLGLGPNGRANRIRVLPTSWFYQTNPAVAQTK